MEGTTMKRIKQIISEVVDKVTEEINKSIDNYEKKAEAWVYYGDAAVIVEIGYNKENGLLVPVKEVTISHANEQKSPLLQQAIMDALPSWDDIERLNVNNRYEDYFF